MRITVNGYETTLDDGVSVADLLALRQLDPIRVAVEVNECIVPRRTFDETVVRDGDQIEIVTFVGGGLCSPNISASAPLS